MGDSDLTVGPDGEVEERQDAGEPDGAPGSSADPGRQRGKSITSGRGLVVFPPRRRADDEQPGGHWIAGYLPFLATVAAGAVLVVIIALVIGR